MGFFQSKPLTPELRNELMQASSNRLNDGELERLHRKFCDLDKDDNGFLSTDEFLSIPEVAMNSLIMRVISVFDQSGEDKVTEAQFIRTLSVFSTRAPAVDKLRFVFSIFDVDGDGYVVKAEMFQVLKMTIGHHVADDKIVALIDSTFAESDHDKDGRISFDDFQETMRNVDVLPHLSTQF